MNFEDHRTAASTSDTRLHLIQHCVEGCNIRGGQPNDGPLCISIKFVSECCVPRINIHTCANTVVEISAGNIPLKEDLSTAQSVLMTNPLQRNRNCEAYSCIVNDTLAEILNFTHATGGKTETDSQEPTLCHRSSFTPPLFYDSMTILTYSPCPFSYEHTLMGREKTTRRVLRPDGQQGRLR